MAGVGRSTRLAGRSGRPGGRYVRRMLQHASARAVVRATFAGRERCLLVLIVATAGLVRFGWCVYGARTPVGLHDSGFYRVFGERLADGDGYTLLDGSPTAYFPVGYPFLLGAAFLLTPDGWQTGVVAGINIVAQLALVILVYATTRLLLGGRAPWALVAATLVAVWPNLILNSAVALTESLFTALLLGAVFVGMSGLWGEQRPDTRRLVVIGLLLGAATYVRPVTVTLVPVFLVVWLVAGSGWRKTMMRTAVVTAVMAAFLAPWVIRNAVVMEAAVLSTNTGDNLCMSRRPAGSGGFEFPNERCNSGPFDAFPRPAYETERDQQGRRLALEFVRDHPIEEMRLWLRRLDLALRTDDDGIAAVESYGDDRFMGSGVRRALGRIANGYYYLVGPIGALGLAMLAWGRRPAALLVALAPVSVLMAIMASFGDPRFKVPILPFLAIGVGVLADRLVLAYGSRLARNQPEANETATAVTHMV